MESLGRSANTLCIHRSILATITTITGSIVTTITTGTGSA